MRITSGKDGTKSEPVYIQQFTNDKKFGCHVCSKMPLDAHEVVQTSTMTPILTLKFRRYNLKHPLHDIYLDVINEPIPYEVISLRVELVGFCFVNDPLMNENNKHLIKKAFDDLLLVTEGFEGNYLLSDICLGQYDVPYYPTFSKFMFMIRFTENNVLYQSIFRDFDPVYYYVDVRVSHIVSDDSISKTVFVKKYIAIVSYLPNFFGQIVSYKRFHERKDLGYQSVKDLLLSINDDSYLKYSCEDIISGYCGF